MAERMKLHLKRISVWPVVKVTFLVSLVLGFILGLIYAMFVGFFLALGSAMQSAYNAEEFGMASAGIMLVFMPIFFAFFTAIAYTIMALVCTLCYNFVARTMGGIEYDVEVLESTRGDVTSTGRFQSPPPPSTPPLPERPDAGASDPGRQDPPGDYDI